MNKKQFNQQTTGLHILKMAHYKSILPLQIEVNKTHFHLRNVIWPDVATQDTFNPSIWEAEVGVAL